MKLFGDRESDGAADSAADDADLLQSLDIGSRSERSDEVLDVFAGFLMVELQGGSADDLEYDFNRSRFAVISRYRQRDALAFFVHSQYDELTGLCLCRDERRLNVHHCDGRVQRLFVYYSVHKLLSFFVGKYRAGVFGSHIIYYSRQAGKKQ